MAEISMTDTAQAAAALVISRLDEKYDLIHVERSDSLSDEQVQHLFAKEVDWDKVLDPEWESESRWQGVKYVLDELLEPEVFAFLEENDGLDEVRHAIEERDQSDPVGDLMNLTGMKLFRYRLDAETESGSPHFSDEELTTAARGLAEAAGIAFWDNATALRTLVEHAFYGGTLHVLWRGAIKPAYDAACKTRFNEPAPKITVQWTDPELLVLDRVNGSGHAVQVRGTVRMEFDPDRLSLDYGPYSWTDVTGGYHPQNGEPEFIYPMEK